MLQRDLLSRILSFDVLPRIVTFWQACVTCWGQFVAMLFCQLGSVNSLPIGRLWLTLAIDVATRCVGGFYLSLESPSVVSVALASGPYAAVDSRS